MTATTQPEDNISETAAVILTRESDQENRIQEKEFNKEHEQEEQEHQDELLVLQQLQITATGTTTTNSSSSSCSVQDQLTQAKLLYQQDKLSQVAKILKSIDSKYLTQDHRHMLLRAQEAEDLVKALKARPLANTNANSTTTTDNNDNDISTHDKGGDAGETKGDWIDQGVSSGTGGKFPTRILHRLERSKTDHHKFRLRARCETPIEKHLLEPLLSVLNETELYETWLPSFRIPKFQIRQCKKLKQCSRVSQVLWVVMDLPWPVTPREIVLSAAAFDSIEDDGHIGIQLKTIDEKEEDVVIPTSSSNEQGGGGDGNDNRVRVDLDGGFLFEKCPRDHPAMKEFQKNRNGNNGEDGKVNDEEQEEEECILVTFAAVMDPHMKLLPQSFLNFLVKTALGTAWRMLLSIAQDVKDGKRPDHAKAIEQKRQEVYDYVRERVDVMLSNMKGDRMCNV
jgi:hypothetical protein